MQLSIKLSGVVINGKFLLYLERHGKLTDILLRPTNGLLQLTGIYDC